MKSDLTQDLFSGKTLLILGAGYVGRAVGKSFQDLGGRVLALTRNSLKAIELRNQGMDTVEGEISGHEWHAQIESKPDFILDCVSSGGGGLEGYQRSYLAGAESIVSWGKQSSQAGHLVYTGSTSVYAQGEGTVVDESMPADAPEDRAMVLQATERTIGQWGGRWTVLRLAGIYGPSRHHILDGFRAGNETVPGAGAAFLNLVHLQDIVGAVLRVFVRSEVAAGRIFNVADDGQATKAEVVQWLALRLGRPVPRFSGKPVPGRRVSMPSRIISNARLKAELGWAPRFPTFREGYNQILEA
jgi:nucleoside-diphosphate-sugar epimerase